VKGITIATPPRSNSSVNTGRSSLDDSRMNDPVRADQVSNPQLAVVHREAVPHPQFI
jgi:hypothetical protein